METDHELISSHSAISGPSRLGAPREKGQGVRVGVSEGGGSVWKQACFEKVMPLPLSGTCFAIRGNFTPLNGALSKCILICTFIAWCLGVEPSFFLTTKPLVLFWIIIKGLWWDLLCAHVWEGCRHMCHFYGEWQMLVIPLFRYFHKKCRQCRFCHNAICMLHWAGRKQFKQSRSKVSQMRCAGHRRGGNWAVCRLALGACLFYKQWEQISIGARLHRPYGEDVLCVRRLLTNHCVGHTVTGIIFGHH